MHLYTNTQLGTGGHTQRVHGQSSTWCRGQPQVSDHLKCDVCLAMTAKCETF